MSKRSILARLAILVPALVLTVAMVSTMSCGGGLFPEVTNSKSPTATPSGGTGNFAFVTDIKTGKLVPFTRNTSTGKLTRGSAVNAGATGSGLGPQGMGIPSGNGFIYVANSADNKIYGYSIGSNGAPAPLPTPSFNEGTGTAPQQIAISGNFLWASNTGNGSITSWTLNSSTGELTSGQTQTALGLSQPFGLVVDSLGQVLYVTDKGNGTVRAYSINTGTGLLSLISAVSSRGVNISGGQPTKIVIDPSGSFLYVGDLQTGAISSIGTSAGNLTQATPLYASPNVPFGLGIAQPLNAGNYLLEANQATTINVTANLISPAGTLNPPINFSAGVSVPTGLAVDPQNAFFYTANQGDGTVGTWALNATCGGGTNIVCFVSSTPTEGSSKNSGPYDVILTH